MQIQDEKPEPPEKEADEPMCSFFKNRKCETPDACRHGCVVLEGIEY